DAYGWNRPQLPGQCRPPVQPVPRCPERPAPPPACYPPGNFERSTETTSWNKTYDRTATGDGRGYDYGSRGVDTGSFYNPYTNSSCNWDRGWQTRTTGYDNTATGGNRGGSSTNQRWDKGNYSNPIATGTWDNYNYQWNQGSDNGLPGSGQWNAGRVGWSNSSENNAYTRTHQQSRGGVDVAAGNAYGSSGGSFLWDARNDNGRKTGGLSWGGPMGNTEISWNGTDELCTYTFKTKGVAGSTAYTFGTAAPRN